ncbi:MAG: MerR family transcriptional regulator [Myxococcota bacterium]
MTSPSAKSEKRLLRISELAALTDVPPASIKFYIKEGLLPAPIKTSRNMAYYDEDFVERIRFIKTLQTRHFLPLRVIREILAETNGNGSLAEAEALLALRGSLPSRAGGMDVHPLSEAEVIERYNTYTEELETLRRMGIVTPTEKDGLRVYAGSDLEFLAALENNRRLGFTREIGFQVEDLKIYLSVLERLAKEEVKLLLARTASKLSIEDIEQLAERGIREFGPLLMVLRQKMILKVLSELLPGTSGPGAGGEEAEATGAPAPGPAGEPGTNGRS